jgi:small conductance mechanosensitive channel
MLPASNSIVWQEGMGDALLKAFGNLFEEVVSWIPQLSAALTVFAIFLIVGLMVRRTMKTMLGRVTRVAPRIRILILRLVFGGILAVGSLAFLGVLTGASLGSVVAGLGLLSVGLGFALKSPLENILSGILTILFAPFRIGDEIEVSGYAGRVETISVHDTIILTFDGKRVAVPNVDVYLNAVTDRKSVV